jgi:hypothetical protein
MKRISIIGFSVVVLLAFFLFSEKAHSILVGDVDADLLKRSIPDECFCGMGNPNNDVIDTFSQDATVYCPTVKTAAGGDTSGNGCCSGSLCGANPSCTLNMCGNNTTTCPATNCNSDSTCIGFTPCIPKYNHSYVWGMTYLNNNHIWFGTFANALCQVSGEFFSALLPLTPQIDSNGASPNTVCEFGFSEYPHPANFTDSFKDQRPPRIYSYDTATDTLTERVVDGPCDATLLEQVIGMRSAGSIKIGNDYLVILAGRTLDAGLAMFAFRDSDGECIQSVFLPQFNDIRKWANDDNKALYTAVGNTPTATQVTAGGSVLRWRGTLANPFSGGSTGQGFDIVGILDSSGANMAFGIDGGTRRLFVTTWPNLNVDNIDTQTVELQTLLQSLTGLSGVFMSPPVPTGGLTTSNANGWKKVFDILKYEPGLITALSLGGGDIAFFGGWIYWGTMQVPLTGAIVHLLILEPDLLDPANTPPQPPGCIVQGQPIPDPSTIPGCQEFVTFQQRLTDSFANSNRPTAVFRGRNFSSKKPEIQVLYGEAQLPVFFPNSLPGSGGEVGGTWSMLPNVLRQTPKYGHSGIGESADITAGNPDANYTWTLKVWNRALYLGTYDGNSPNSNSDGGGDLWRFKDSNSSAIPVDLTGLGNHRSYGLRTMVGNETTGCLYIGMANPYNLRQTADLGGWELIKLFPTNVTDQNKLKCFPTP